jgi:hypothetical protein
MAKNNLGHGVDGYRGKGKGFGWLILVVFALDLSFGYTFQRNQNKVLSKINQVPITNIFIFDSKNKDSYEYS